MLQTRWLRKKTCTCPATASGLAFAWPLAFGLALLLPTISGGQPASPSVEPAPAEQPTEAETPPTPALSDDEYDRQNGTSIHKVEGEPVRVIFRNGDEIGFRLRQVFAPLKVAVTASENTCTGRTGDRLRLVVPLLFRSLVPYWTKHASKRGQPVIYRESSGQREVRSTTTYVTRLRAQAFAHFLTTLSRENFLDLRDRADATASPVFARMECAGPCRPDLFPNVARILFWDENFETGNEELGMYQQNRSASVNQTTARRENVGIRRSASRVEFLPPERSLGVAVNFAPPGVAYQILWQIQARNLAVQNDPLCQIKWDVDFTTVFTQFTSQQNQVDDPNLVKLDRMPIYLYDPLDEQSNLSDAFGNHRFVENGVER